MKEQKLAPFCHIFEAGGQTYIYDVNTNQLLAAEPALAAVLPLYGTMSHEEMARQLKMDKFLSIIQDACATIGSAQCEEGLFLVPQTLLAPPDPRRAQPGVCDSGLRHLVLTVTEQCNLRCSYCMHGSDLDWVRTHGTTAMTTETALESVRYFLERHDPDHTPVISFYGGEALLEPGLIEEVMTTARTHPGGEEVMFSIDTNGVLLTDAVVDLAVRFQSHIQISLDGTRDQHDRHRVDAWGKGTFDRILEAVGRLLVADASAAERLSFIITMAPPGDLFAVADFFAEFPPYRDNGITGTPNLRVNFANLNGQEWPGQEEGFQALGAQVEQMREMYLEAVAAGTREELSPVVVALFEPELIRFWHRSRAPLGETFTPGGNCLPGKRKLHVMPDGSFHPCERTGKNMGLGNLVAGIEPMDVRGLQERFHEAVADRCGSCWALRQCGVCYASQAEFSNAETGEFPVPESLCESIRNSREQTMKMMARMLEMPPERLAWLDDTIIV
jgi:uncharacterized protein